jgi:hypothetical protein
MEFFKFVFTAEADTTGEENTPADCSSGTANNCVIA